MALLPVEEGLQWFETPEAKLAVEQAFSNAAKLTRDLQKTREIELPKLNQVISR